MKTVYAGGEGEIVEKKSRFIATVRLVEKEEDALAFIEEMKKKYWDARHNCSAFIIGSRGELTRCSDDGEPSGTAGSEKRCLFVFCLPFPSAGALSPDRSGNAVTSLFLCALRAAKQCGPNTNAAGKENLPAANDGQASMLA